MGNNKFNNKEILKFIKDDITNGIGIIRKYSFNKDGNFVDNKRNLKNK